MTIKIYAIGKIKDFYKSGCDEYLKRISGYSKIEVIELKDESISDKPSPSEITKVKDIEGKRVLSLVKNGEYLIGLDLNKKQYTSEEFASFLNQKLIDNGANIAFVIGGSYGLSDELKKRVNTSICLSNMTLPHQLARLVLLEQIFRVFKIINNESYHK